MTDRILDARMRERGQKGRAAYRADAVAMLRFPALSDTWLTRLSTWGECELKDELGILFDDPYVNEAIWLASPALHTRLVAWRNGDDHLAHSAQALLRYVLRMAYRPTPFGLFAGVASMGIGGSGETIRVPDRHTWKRSVRLDSSAVLGLVANLKQDPTVTSRMRYYPNGSLVRLGDVAHYIEVGADNGGPRSYRLSEVDYSRHVEMALALSQQGSTPDELKSMLKQTFPEEATGDIREFVDELIEKEILCCDHLLKVTSGNLLRGLTDECDHVDAAIAGDLKGLDGILGSLERSPFDAPVDLYRDVRETLRRLNVKKAQRSTVQVDLYAEAAPDTGLDRACVAKVERVATQLMTWGKKTQGRLGEFSKRFSARYGDASVPLLEALDDVAGVGLGAERGRRPALAACLPGSGRARHEASSSPRMREIEHWMEKATAWDESSHYIHVTDRMAKGLADVSTVDELPKHVTAWCSLWKGEGDDKPVLEIRKMSSQHPGRLFGRFASALPDIREVISERDDDGSGPIVAEIVHLPFGRTGNVVSRPRLTEWEITLRSGTATGAKELPLSDLHVCLSHGELMLHSKSQGRQVIPRMSNAHTFSSPQALQVYTFLNELAVQKSRSLPFSLRQESYARRFYPGLVYDGVVIARPSWRLFIDDIDELRRSSEADRPGVVSHWRAMYGMPSWVAVVDRDNVLPFNLDSPWMMKEFIKLSLRSTSIEIMDVYPRGMKPAIAGETGQHHAEILVPLTAPSAPYRSPELGAAWGETSRMPLWSPWLSLNIYCHPDVQKEVLFRLHRRVLAGRDAETIDRFFFVRYADSAGNHLRFRVRTGNGEPGTTLWSSLAMELSAMTRERLIGDVTQVPYIREVTRYGGEEACHHCEAIFALDSAMVLDVLNAWPDHQASDWHLPAAAFDSMLAALGLDAIEERHEFATEAASHFAKEFAVSSDDRKRIGDVFRQHKPLGRRQGLFDIDHHIAQVFESAANDIKPLWSKITGCTVFSPEKLYSIRWALVHMRANRLFHRDARKQEAVVWDLLRRTYAQAMARR